MWLSDRRKFLVGAACVAACVAALSGCGFAPAYGPQGGAQGLQRAVALSAPQGRAGYLLHQRIEERLGRAVAPKVLLSTQTKTRRQGLGSTADGRTTRFQVIGETSIKLTVPGGDEVLHESTVDAFTGYSASGSTVATLAAEEDAEARLMVILADKIVDRLILLAPDLPLQ